MNAQLQRARLQDLQTQLDTLTAKEQEFGYTLPAERQRLEHAIGQARAMSDKPAAPRLPLEGENA